MISLPFPVIGNPVATSESRNCTIPAEVTWTATAGNVEPGKVETIRYYEKEGLLPKIGRTGSNYRVYTDVHVDRLLFIRHCRSLDMTLDEIRVLLHFKDMPKESCDRVNALLDEHIGHVAERIRDLKKLEKQLRMLRESCREAKDTASCGILNALSCPVSGTFDENGSTCSHVHRTHGGDLHTQRKKTD